MEDSRSPVIREKVWNWYTGTVYNRLQADGAVIVINQRMHEDDLSGRLIEQMKAGKDQWTIVELPAIAIDHDRDGHRIIDPLGRKAGEALWPEEYDLKRIERRRDNTLARWGDAGSGRQGGLCRSFCLVPFWVLRGETPNSHIRPRKS
jgi:hypothetical protein